MPTHVTFAQRLAAPVTVAVLALLAGCAAAPPTPQSLPDPLSQGLPSLAAAPGQATTAPGLSIARWWAAFGDPELDALVAQALAHNTDLATAAARLREAQARLGEVHAQRLPALELQSGSRRARSATDTLPPGAERPASRHGVSLVGDFEVDLWGRLAAADDAARARLAAQQWARDTVEWSLSAQVAEAHFSIRAIQRQIEIARAVRISRERTVQLRQRELLIGSAGEFELRRAESELASADSRLATLEKQRVALDGTLALLCGRPVAQVTMSVSQRAPLDTGRAQELRLPQGEAATMIERRPDVRRAESELVAAKADVAAARAATLPALRLSGSIGSDARELSGLFNGPGFVWSVAASLAQSVFDGGAAKSRVEQAASRQDQALLGYRRAVAGAVVELRDAYAGLELTQDTLSAEQRRVAALERSHRLAQAGVSVGALNQLDLLDAERNRYQAQLAEVDAYRDRLIGQVAVYKALGGGVGAQP